MKDHSGSMFHPIRRVVSSVFCIAFLYLGAINAILARVAGTCTQGDATRLYGIITTGLLCGLGLLALRMSLKAGVVDLMLSPFLVFALWQAGFSVRLSFEILALGRSAFSVLQGATPPYPMSGSEAFFAISWPLISFTILFSLCSILFARHKGRRTAKHA